VLNPDGIVLSGGNTPVAYGGQSKERDCVDELLISYSVEKNLPLIGVCRGMQSICLYFGGSLKQVKGHVRVRHNIEGLIKRNVNSYHEWSPDYQGDNIEVLCRSDDDGIEMVHHVSLSIYGMMWHPEREKPFNVDDIDFFKKTFMVI
jgi:putative glutamine amidotransferase